MRVHYVIEVADYKPSRELISLIDDIEKIVWQRVSGRVVGYVIEPQRSV